MSNIVMVDCDGVLLDFNKGFAESYKKVFDKELSVIRKNAFTAVRMYGLEEQGNYRYFTGLFSEKGLNFWRDLPAYDNAVKVINELVEKGYDVRCLTSMPPEFKEDRLHNLQKLGFKIDIIYPVSRDMANKKGIRNPKLAILEEHQPLAFIDDLISNFLDCNHVSTNLYLLDNDYAKGDNPNEEIKESLNYFTVKKLQDFVDLFPDLTVKNNLKI